MPDRHRPRHGATSPRSKPRNKPKQHSGQLWQPTYFTVLGDYRSVVADTEADLDINPDLAPITATVTFTPVLASGDAIRASKADPQPTIYVPVPIVGHISADGRLKLRDAPAGRQENHENLSVLPTAGADGVAYMTVDDGRVWRWNGTTYIEDYNYTPIRLLADTALLELSSPLYYRVNFTDVRFNGELGYLSPITFAAPQSDEVLNLVNVTRRTGETAVGVVRVGPTGVRLNDAGDVVFTIGGRDIPDPLTLSTVDVNGPAGPAGPPGPQGPIGPIPADMARLPDIADASAKSRDFATTEVMRLRGEMVSALTGLVHGVSVLSIADDAPPTATDGDVFIVSAAPTGVFAGHANTVASMTGVGWTFHDPDPREAHLNEADNAMWVWNGTDWVKVGSVAKSSLAGDIQAAGPKSSPVDADQFVLIDSEDTWAAKNITWSAILAALSTLTDVDVDVSMLNDGDMLAWDGSKWVPTVLRLDTDALEDVSLLSPQNEDFLVFNGAEWENRPVPLGDLADLAVVTPADGEVLTYDGGVWINQAPAAVPTTLDALTDVNASTPADEDILQWDAVAGQWINRVLSGDLADLSDVDVSVLNNGDTLTWDGSKWVSAALRLDTDALEDVSLQAPQNEDFLVFNGTEWENRPVPLGDLSDLALTAGTDGEVLTFDTVTSQWVNRALPGYTQTEVDTKLESLVLGLAHGESVNSITATPPSAPVEGDLVIVATGATGAFSGHVNSLALWHGGKWVFTPPEAKETHLVEDQDALFHWNGTTWVKVATASGASALTDLTDVRKPITPSVGQVLAYNSDSKWAPVNLAPYPKMLGFVTSASDLSAGKALSYRIAAQAGHTYRISCSIYAVYDNESDQFSGSIHEQIGGGGDVVLAIGTSVTMGGKYKSSLSIEALSTPNIDGNVEFSMFVDNFSAGVVIKRSFLTVEDLGTVPAVPAPPPPVGGVTPPPLGGWVAPALVGPKPPAGTPPVPPTLAALADVDTSSAADKTVLQWDDTARLWKPVADLG